MKRFVQLFLLSVVLVLSACGSKSKLDGRYANQSAAASYTFKSNGKVTVSVMSGEFEMNYEVDGNKVTITNPLEPAAGPRVMTLMEDGSIQSPYGIKFTKQNGSRLDGAYAAQSAAGEMSYTFKSNGKVTASFMDREYEGNYEIEGNKVKIKGLPGEGTQVLTLLEDGSIQGMGMKFTKRKN